MGEELKVKAERDLEEDIKQKAQDIEMDKGRSTKNITEEYEQMWKGSAEAEKRRESIWNSRYERKDDPLMQDLNKTGSAGKEFFDQGKRATEQQLKNIRKNWDESSFFYDNSGSSHSGGGFRSHYYGVSRVTIAFIVALFTVLAYMEISNKNDMYSTNLYLQELEKLKKLDLEPVAKKQDRERKGEDEIKASDT